MSIHGYCKKTWRVLLVSLLLVFSLNTVASAENFGEYELQVVSTLHSIEDAVVAIQSLLDSSYTVLSTIKDNLTYNNKSVAYYANVTNNNLLSRTTKILDFQEDAAADLATIITKLTSVNTNLSTMITKLTTMDTNLGTVVTKLTTMDTNLGTVVTNLTTMDTNLGTVVTKLTSVDTDLDTVIETLSTLNDNLFTLGTVAATMENHLDTVIIKLDSVIEYQSLIFQNFNGCFGVANEELAYIRVHAEEIWGQLVDLNGQVINLILAQEDANTTLSNIETLLTYNEKSAAHLIGMMNNNLIYRTNDILDYQEAAAADLATMIDKLTSANTSLSTISSEITSADDRLSTVVTKVTAMDTSLSSVVTKITSVDSRLSTMVTKITSLDTNLSSIVTSQENILSDADSILLNLGYVRTSLQNIFTELTNVGTDVSHIRNYLATWSPSITGIAGSASTISNKLNAVMENQESAVTKLDAMICNQDDLLALLQQDGVFTTDISGVLTDLDAVLSNQSTLVTSLSGVSTNLSSVVTKITSADSRLNTVNTNLTTMINNQSDLLTLLQQDGVFTTDISGIIINQVAGMTLLSNIENALNYSGKSITAYVYDLRTDLNGVIKNQNAILTSSSAGVTSLVEKLDELNTTLTDSLNHNNGSVAEHAYSVRSSLTRIYNTNNNISTKLSAIFDELTLVNARDTVAYNLASLVSLQQELIELIEDLDSATVENIQNITIDINNEAYEIFYITDGDGNDQNLADFSGDILTISGRLLNFFFKVAFDDAMSSVDSTLDDMTAFYLDDSVVLEGSSLWE